MIDERTKRLAALTVQGDMEAAKELHRALTRLGFEKTTVYEVPSAWGCHIRDPSREGWCHHPRSQGVCQPNHEKFPHTPSEDLETPEWCPLREGPLVIRLKQPVTVKPSWEIPEKAGTTCPSCNWELKLYAYEHALGDGWDCGMECACGHSHVEWPFLTGPVKSIDWHNLGFEIV